jgi:hypothetical protein
MYTPPTGMTVNSTAQWIITIIQFVAAAIATVWVTWGQRGRELRIRVLVLIGGGLGVFFEPLGDRLGMIWHASVGQWTLLHMYGHFVPVWMLATYYWYCGGQTLFVVQRIRNGAPSSEIWRLYWIFLAMDAVLELPLLYVTDIYTYFGNQPFWWPPYFPLPGWYLVLNALLPLAAARSVIYLLGFNRGRYEWLIPAAIPMSLFAIYGATAWPTWAALNSDVTLTTSFLCGSLTVALGLLSAHLLSASLPKSSAIKG